MKYEKKFRPQEQVSETQSQSQANQTIREFASPEEMLRFDAKQTLVPPGVAQRLSRSLQNEPQPQRPWWKRWFR
jgi:hypothetical protein